MLGYIILGLVVLLVIWLIAIYNGLVTLKNRTDEAWSDISVQLKRRYDLIPNLISTVKGYAAHEKQLFEQVSEARARAMGAGSRQEQAQAENALSGTLKSLFAIAESYPELKANVNFLELQRELTDTEDKIQASRRFYNGNVRDFNTKMQVFPNNLVVGMLGYKPYEFFQATEEEKENIKVEF